MLRQQRRFELREMTKEIDKFHKTDLYKSMVRYFDRLPKEEYLLLEEGYNSDKKHNSTPNNGDTKEQIKQNEFNGYMRLMKGYIELQTRIDYLKSVSPKGKQD